jgi:PAS domain S-box-containing protein
VQGVKDYAIYLLNKDGVITTWNPGAQRIKGYTAEEIVGKNFACFYTPENIRQGRPRRSLELAAMASMKRKTCASEKMDRCSGPMY